jgi:hypothetical protein
MLIATAAALMAHRTPVDDAVARSGLGLHPPRARRKLISGSGRTGLDEQRGLHDTPTRDTGFTSSAANLDLVRSIFAAWERGDFGSVEWADPEIEFVIADGPAPGSWNGLAGMVKGWRDFLSAWESWRGEAEEYRDLDGERVLVLILGSGRGRRVAWTPSRSGRGA